MSSMSRGVLYCIARIVYVIIVIFIIVLFYYLTHTFLHNPNNIMITIYITLYPHSFIYKHKQLLLI